PRKRPARLRSSRRRSVLAHAVVAALRQAAQELGRRREPYRRGRLRRLGDRRAVPEALRAPIEALRASRHFRLGAARPARTSARRRAARRARSFPFLPSRAWAVVSDGDLPDPRRHAYRVDLADARLEGLIAAERYVQGEPRQVVAPSLVLRREPRADSILDTEALKGETVTVFAE